MTTLRKELSRTSRGVVLGATMSTLLMSSASIANMLTEPPRFSGDKDPLPNFAAADIRFRVAYLAGVLVLSAIIGGLADGILGRLSFALARLGVRPLFLKGGLAVIGIAVGGALARPTTLTVQTAGALAFSLFAGAAVGVLLGERVARSAKLLDGAS